MAEKFEIDTTGAEARGSGAVTAAPGVEDWFLREVFPLEGMLMHFLRQNWRNQSDIDDLRQEIYVRVYEAARKELPTHPKQFVLRTARNLLINHVRREQIVRIEALADLDVLGSAVDAPGPERSAIARDMLRRLQSALDRLPPRCREVVVLGRIEGLTRDEIATRMNISADTVSEHLAKGMYALANLVYGEGTESERRP